MTHLSMEALLRLREAGLEPGDAAAREHVESCPGCRLELDRLHQRVARLKALPALRPTRDRWPETAARFRAERRQRIPLLLRQAFPLWKIGTPPAPHAYPYQRAREVGRARDCRSLLLRPVGRLGGETRPVRL